MTLSDIEHHVTQQIFDGLTIIEFALEHEGEKYHVYLELGVSTWDDHKSDQKVIEAVYVRECGVSTDEVENVPELEKVITKIVETI